MIEFRLIPLGILNDYSPFQRIKLELCLNDSIESYFICLNLDENQFHSALGQGYGHHYILSLSLLSNTETNY